MRRVVVLAGLLFVVAVPAALPLAAADHEIPICVPFGNNKPYPGSTCIGVAEGPHVPDVPPICYREPGSWPPRQVCLN